MACLVRMGDVKLLLHNWDNNSVHKRDFVMLTVGTAMVHCLCFDCINLFTLINSGAPYSYRKEKETHELIFSWLSLSAVLLVGAFPRQRRQRLRQSHATWRPYSKY